MIKFTEIQSLFQAHNIVVHEFNLETDEDVAIPYVAYTINDAESFSADGISYFKTLEITLAIFDETPNFALQREIEEVLDTNTAFFDKQVNFDNDSRIYTVGYHFTVVDDAVH